MNKINTRILSLFTALCSTLGFQQEAQAQGLFEVPDTVCVGQKVKISNVVAASSYYWNFCSGDISKVPSPTFLNNPYGAIDASGMKIVKVDLNYYGFVIDKNGGGLTRVEFGGSLNNTPTYVNLGNMANAFPSDATGLDIVQQGTEWKLFVIGGTSSLNSTLCRVDIGPNITNNLPMAVNFGTMPGFGRPHDLHLFFENNEWYALTLNGEDNSIFRFDFGPNIQTTPTGASLGNPGNELNTSNGFAAIQENGESFLFVCNQGDNKLIRVDFGSGFSNTTLTATDLGNQFMNGPADISFIKDCGKTYALVPNALDGKTTRLTFEGSLKDPFIATDLGNMGSIANPVAISTFIRDNDAVYTMVVNGNNTFTQLKFANCMNSSIISTTQQYPDVYKYDAAGVYNIFLSINDGQPNAQVQCKPIVVLPKPEFSCLPDTLMCQGDTIELRFLAASAISYHWSPNYNIQDTLAHRTKIWPRVTTGYTATVIFDNGCIIDSTITVEVSQVYADAGPDKVIADGSYFYLDGSNSSQGPGISMVWNPKYYIDNDTIPTPRCEPKKSISYYLTVTNSDGCKAVDTVRVNVDCSDLYLPNAFSPSSKEVKVSTFGLMNYNVTKLNYLKIYDRWGQEVFSTTTPETYWDGTFNGLPQPMGNYVWIVDGVCNNGIRFKKQGNVLLIR
jgi:gliding motility-associated-like protein